MNKQELVAKVAARSRFREPVVQEVLDLVVDEIKKAVAAGEAVGMRDFGTFRRQERAPRVARNPRTNEAVPIPPTTVPRFVPGQGFKDMVADGGPR